MSVAVKKNRIQFPNNGLTGNRRYRQIRGIYDCGDLDTVYLLLQVEVSVWNDTAEGKEVKWVCEWRDATPADLTVEDIV